ncbi:MAG: hypothetical protein U0821_10610 [Chloroflexota bacterium]
MRQTPQLVLALATATILAGAIAGPSSRVADAQAECTFRRGFDELHRAMPDLVGACSEDEQVDPETGDLTQRTTTGLLMWRKRDNWTAFTDGPNTYLLGTAGIEWRATDGPRLPWESSLPPPAAPGRGVLLREIFDDPRSVWCSHDGTSADGHMFGCVNGEYVIAGVLQGHFALEPSVGRYANASIAIDARLLGGSEGRDLLLNCRDQRPGSRSVNLLSVMPATQEFFMSRFIQGRVEMLVPPTRSEAIRPGNENNRLELTCAGDRVTAYANGVELGSFRDNLLRSGSMGFGVGNVSAEPLSIRASFDNLVVEER